MADQVDISIVFPVFNEEKNLEELYLKINETLSEIGKSYEIIAVDDGSIDKSFDVLRKFCLKDPKFKAIRFRRNFGQTAALSAGFHHAKGNIIITMDSDLQNDPSDIPRLLEKIDEGYDVVSGWRADRKDKFISRRLPSVLANKLIVKMTGVNIHDFGCTLKAYRKDVVENINLYGEMHRFIPALAKWIGAEITEIKVKHHPRKHGKSKYGISRTIRVILDLLTIKFLLSFSTKPIQIFGLIGLGSSVLGFFICLYLSIGKIFFPSEATSLTKRMPMLLLGVLLILVGVQLITMGLLGEIIVRTYYESQNKAIYVIRETINMNSNQE
ncbi:MAG: glycosyltransferase family 2 protein [bacterium]